MTENKVSSKIIGASIEVHKQLEPGLLINFNSLKIVEGIKRNLNGISKALCPLFHWS